MGGAYSKPAEVQSKHFPAFFDALPSMTGKVVCITGCTSGTGLIAAKAIAQKGGEVVMLNRPSERATKAEAAVKEAAPGAKVSTVACDLQSLDSVRSCAEELKHKYGNGIDVLCCNAGEPPWHNSTPDKEHVLFITRAGDWGCWFYRRRKVFPLWPWLCFRCDGNGRRSHQGRL